MVERTCQFKIEDESVYLKYNEIWNKIKSLLHLKLHDQPCNILQIY